MYKYGGGMSGKSTVLTDFDKRLGRLIALHRARHGLSQKDLASAMGCSFQQVQKYECAGNRMAVSRLYDMCKCLGIPMGQFLQEADSEYTQDPKLMHIMQNLYKMTPDQVKIIARLTDDLVRVPAAYADAGA